MAPRISKRERRIVSGLPDRERRPEDTLQDAINRGFAAFAAKRDTQARRSQRNHLRLIGEAPAIADAPHDDIPTREGRDGQFEFDLAKLR
jgi:hypothetical protein